MLRSRFSHDATENNVYIWCIITFRNWFSRDALKLLYLLHYHVIKQVFSWRPKKVQICCIITWKSRFSHDAPKNFYIWCINTWKSRFSHDPTENNVYIWCIFTFRSRFSRDALKTLIFVALLHVKAGFLMTCLKGCKCNALLRGKAGFLMMRQNFIFDALISGNAGFHDATENKVYICCIGTFRSRFSHDAQRLLYLMHYNVEEQVFSWRAKNSYIWCIISWKSRFSHDAPKMCRIAALLRGKAGFPMTCQKLLYLMH